MEGEGEKGAMGRKGEKRKVIFNMLFPNWKDRKGGTENAIRLASHGGEEAQGKDRVREIQQSPRYLVDLNSPSCRWPHYGS